MKCPRNDQCLNYNPDLCNNMHPNVEKAYRIDINDFENHATRSCHKDDTKTINDFINFYQNHYDMIAIHNYSDVQDEWVCLHAIKGIDNICFKAK